MLHLFALVTYLGLASAAPTTEKRWYPQSLGANYFQTNNFAGNQLVASYVMPDGSLVSGTATCTQGNGSAGINDPAPYMNHPDPFYGSGSVVVVGSQVMAVNAGSDTFAVFDIDNEDPARPCFNNVYPTGQFPVSLAASPDGNIVCALNSGADNGFKCYSKNGCDWMYMPDWDRSFGLNTTTPPHGPVGGTPSQMVFSSDMTFISVAIKGRLPTDLNNPTGNLTEGGFWQYPLTWSNGSWALGQNYTSVTAPVPFSIVEDMNSPGTFVSSDVAAGYDVSNLTATNGTSMLNKIPGNAANCWGVQSNLTGDFYFVDTAHYGNITEVAVDAASLNGTVLAQHSTANGSLPTDASVFFGGWADWLYVNVAEAGYVDVWQINGPGNFSVVSTWNPMDDMPEGWNSNGSTIAGQALYYKTW